MSVLIRTTWPVGAPPLLEVFKAVLVSLPLPGCELCHLFDLARNALRPVPLILHDPAGTASAGNPSLPDWVKIVGGKFDVAEIGSLIRQTAEQRFFNGAPGPWRQSLVGESLAIQQVIESIRLVGSRRATVLITGETGTGKELVARALHMASPRAHRQIVAFNCAALPETLFETELFGHTKGAFTGAHSARIGRFEQAHQSTLLLDEISEMPLDVQVKLLRALQEREIQRVGSAETIKVDVRVIAATNADLRRAVEEKRFRQDLFYRLNVVPLRVPPLRERLSDIPLLVNHFVDQVCRQEGLATKKVTQEAVDLLSTHSWPGNVRELEHYVEMAVALSGERRLLDVDDFRLPEERPAPEPLIEVPDTGIDLEDTILRIERALVESALRRSRGNKKMAADMLGMKRTSLIYKMKAIEACA